MGGVVKGVFGKGGILGGSSDAASQAAAAQVAGQQQGIATLRENLGPFAQAGIGQLPGLQEGATAGGLDARLAQIFGGSQFQNLVGERTRAVQGGLSAAGLNRSGAGLQAAANIPTDLGLQLEQLLTGRSQTLASQGQQAAAGLGGQVANLQAGIGQTRGQGIITQQQADVAQAQNAIGTVATVASFFSDPRLKENVEEIADLGPLKLYQWDWIAKVKDTFIANFPTIGFMADEVEKVFPEFVNEHLGFKMINYHDLLNELEAA